MLKLLGSLLILFVVLAGCTREDSPRRAHEATAVTADPSSTTPQAVSPNAIASKDSAEFIAKLRSRLDLAKLENEKRNQSEADRATLLALVTQAGDLVMRLDPKDAKRGAILDVVEKALTAGCDERLAGCLYTAFFKANPGSTTILLALADRSMPDLRARYRYLSLAFATVGQNEDPRIQIAYLKTSPAFEKLLERELQRSGSPDTRTQLTQHREILESSFNELRKTGALTDDMTADLESAFDIWNFDRIRDIGSATREEKLFSLVAPKLVLGGASNMRFQKQFALLKAKPESAVARLALIKPAARESLGLKAEIPTDINTFIFDGLWLGRLTNAEANILWDAYLSTQTSRNAREIAQLELLNYAKTRLLISAKTANAVITEFYTSGKFGIASAFRDGLKESARGVTIWDDSVRRFEILRDFSNHSLRSADTSDKNGMKLDMFFASIDRNIKVLSTYPSMLVMTYHLARLGFSMTFDSWTGKQTIDAGQILDWYFSGILTPWMKYSNDPRPLSSSEIAMVFHYALEMGIFSDGGINIENLFKMLSGQMTGKLRIDAEQIADGFSRSYEFTTEFDHSCTAIMVAKDIHSGITISPPVKLVDLSTRTLHGVPDGPGDHTTIDATFNSGWNFFELEKKTSRTLEDNLEIIRLELTPKIDYIKMLARLADEHMKRHGTTEREKIVQEIQKQLAPLEAIRKRIYSLVFKLAKKNGPCAEKIVEAELSTQLYVIKGLVQHFTDVHAAMKKAREHSLSPTLIDHKFDFSDKLKIDALKQHESALGFNSEMFRVSRLQVLLRIADILENGYLKDGQPIGPRREKGTIQLPKIRDLDQNWRSEFVRLDWNDDLDEFVADAIQQIFDRKTGFILWSNLSSLGLSIQFRLRGIAALVQAGTVDTDTGPQRFEPKELMRMNFAMEKWLEIENTDWMNVLAITGEFTRVRGDGMLGEFAWDSASHAWFGLFDFAFWNIRADKLGSGAPKALTPPQGRYTRRIGPSAGYLAHAKVMKAFGEPTLTIPDSTMSDLTRNFTATLDAHMDLVAETIELVRKMEPIRAANPNAFPSWRIFASRKPPAVPLLSSTELEAFRLESYELVRQTGYKLPARVEKAFNQR